MGCPDTLGGVGFIFLAIAFIAYGAVVSTQKSRLTSSTLKLSVLSTRTAMFLPIYSLMIWLSLVVPDLYIGLQFPISLFEGYSFFSFFALLVTNLGGPQGCVDSMRSLKRLPYCSCCCPEEAGKFFLRVRSALFHMLTTRMVIVFITVITGYVGAKVVTILFSLVSLVLVINAFLSLINFYEYIYDLSGNLYATMKIFLLKLSIVLIVFQAVIVELIIAFSGPHTGPSCQFTANEQAMRIYCFVVLVEFGVLSFLVYFAYGKEITENQVVVTGRLEGTNSSNGEGFFVGICDYIGKLCNFGDIWYLFYSTIDTSSSTHDLNQNLVNSA